MYTSKSFRPKLMLSLLLQGRKTLKYTGLRSLSPYDRTHSSWESSMTEILTFVLSKMKKNMIFTTGMASMPLG